MSDSINSPVLPLISNEKNRVYFDHNATTPVAERVLERVPEWLLAWGNPSSIHQSGRRPKAILRRSRQLVAAAIGCTSQEVIFTSGGSEANNLAIKGVFFANRDSKRNEYIFSAVEHPSVKGAADFLQRQGAIVHWVPVQRDGALDLERFEELVSEKTVLVSMMYANNETGNILPVKKLAKRAHQMGALVHCDAVQALGKVPLNVEHLGVDLCSFSAHKVYALKGCGVLYSRRGVQLESTIHGGGQERGRRAGTENILGIASLGAVCEVLPDILKQMKEVSVKRDRFEDLLLATVSGCSITGKEGKRLPNTSSVVIAGIDGETLLMNLDLKGFSVSTGAACSSGNPEPSPTLLSMGLTRPEAQSSLRVSLGVGNSEQEIVSFVKVLDEVICRLRKMRSEGSTARMSL